MSSVDQGRIRLEIEGPVASIVIDRPSRASACRGSSSAFCQSAASPVRRVSRLPPRLIFGFTGAISPASRALEFGLIMERVSEEALEPRISALAPTSPLATGSHWRR